jgi:hypothetical protein
MNLFKFSRVSHVKSCPKVHKEQLLNQIRLDTRPKKLTIALIPLIGEKNGSGVFNLEYILPQMPKLMDFDLLRYINYSFSL